MPPIFSKALSPALRHVKYSNLYFLRMATTLNNSALPKHIADTNQGFLRWERSVSRDPKAKNPQIPGDTPYSFLTRRLGHAFEVYPLFAIVGFWVVIFCATVYTSMTKIEVWFDRTQNLAPWDWQRAKEKYYKLHTVFFDLHKVSHRRLPEMEKLQDELVEAAKKRGTRS